MTGSMLAKRQPALIQSNACSLLVFEYDTGPRTLAGEPSRAGYYGPPAAQDTRKIATFRLFVDSITWIANRHVTVQAPARLCPIARFKVQAWLALCPIDGKG